MKYNTQRSPKRAGMKPLAGMMMGHTQKAIGKKRRDLGMMRQGQKDLDEANETLDQSASSPTTKAASALPISEPTEPTEPVSA